MISKSDLTSPNSNFEFLEHLESRLEKSATRLLQDVIIEAFDLENVSFGCSLANVMAKAQRVRDGNYQITFGRPLTSAILNISAYISDQLSQYLNWDHEESIEEFTFFYISWIIFNHEVAHVIHGHLDYLHERGIAGYYEVNELKQPIVHLHDEEGKSRDYWHALESEADAYAASSSLATFRYINSSPAWSKWMMDKVLDCHGVMLSITYHFLNVLAEGTDDFRHPPPLVRQYISLPSSRSLAKTTGHSDTAYVDVVMKAHMKAVSNILRIQLNVGTLMESVSLMFNLDAVVAETGIYGYRRYKR